MWGLEFLTKNVGPLREVVHPLYIARAQIWGRNHVWVVPPIKAHEQRISVCFPLHYPGFIDFQIYFILIRFYEIYYTLICFLDFDGPPKRSPSTSCG
jgi:hypothetical protein